MSTHWFLRAAITNCHKSRVLKQNCICPQFWKLQDWYQGIGISTFSLKILGKNSSLHLSFWWLLVIFGFTWLEASVSPISGCFYVAFSPVIVSLYSNFPFLVRASIILGLACSSLPSSMIPSWFDDVCRDIFPQLCTHKFLVDS